MEQLKATVTVTLMMRKGESVTDAQYRLYDALYAGLCCTAEHTIDFCIEEVDA